MYLHILPFCLCSLKYLWPSGKAKAPSALPSLSGLQQAHHLLLHGTPSCQRLPERCFSGCLSCIRLPGPFVELWSVSISPLHCFSPRGFTPVFNEISSWRTCICGQFNILCKMLAPRASKSSEGYHMTSGHLSEKNENFYSHKNVYTHFIGDVLAVTKGLKTNPNILQLVTR